VLVKICGLRRPEDARLADSLGADFIGVVLTPGFARCLEPAAAAGVLDGTRASRVAVLVDEDAEAAEEKARAIAADVLQLHGDEPPEVVEALRLRGDWTIWKGVRARSASDVTAAVERYGALVDGLLVEGVREGVVGGGGVALDADPDAVRYAIPHTLRFVLAGGLRPETVAAAIATFRPDVVDVSSGIERVKGEKDEGLLRAFFDAVRTPHTTERPR
jgi:phosphoribosylanthranilate isomerase